MSVRVTIVDAVTGDEIAVINAPGNGDPACLTGTYDLPAGEHQIALRIEPREDHDGATFDRAYLQLIIGQFVDEPGCRLGAGG